MVELSDCDRHSKSPIDCDRILVIIPVLNEEAWIGNVIQALQQQGLQHIRVVDNGSTDHSAAIAAGLGAEVISEPQCGYGQACWQGLQNLPAQIEWILFCDGDGSDDLSQLPKFFAAADSADLVLANRRADAASRANLTLAQNWGNALATTLMAWGWGHRYQDLGPMRLVRRSALERIQMQDRAFGWTIEMQVRAIEEHCCLVEIPVPYGSRKGGQSKISGTLRGVVLAGAGILGTLAKLYGQKLRRALQPFSGAIAALSSILLLLGCSIIQPHGHFSSTPSFLIFCLGIAAMVAGFACSEFIPYLSATCFWGVSILARVILLPMAAGDDVWRYLWEGYLQVQGFSPYAFPPNAEELIPYRTEWWELMNYHEISAIYPPVAQLGFQLLARIGLSVLVFKLAFVLADLAVCGLLSRRYGYQNARFYAWNPIVIYSFAGGAHFDSWLILPIVAAWLLAESRRWLASAFCLGISIGVKWISLPLLPFLLWRMRWQRALVLLAVASLPLLMTTPIFCQLGSCSLIPVKSSFVVQARSADLVPYLLSQIWPASRQINWIFALPLAGATFGLLWICKRFGAFAEAYFFALLALSPVVHGWYFTWLVPFAVASRNWGTRLLSVSVFVYFLLPYRQFAGLETQRWHLTAPERALLWLPIMVGFLWSFSSAIKTQFSSATDTHLEANSDL